MRGLSIADHRRVVPAQRSHNNPLFGFFSSSLPPLLFRAGTPLPKGANLYSLSLDRLFDRPSKAQTDVENAIHAIQVTQHAPAINYCAGLFMPHPLHRRKVAELLPRSSEHNNARLRDAFLRRAREANGLI